MFLMLGISEGMKEFEYGQTTVCRGCGRYARYVVYMTYTVLSLFFIPCFKWNKQYFVRTSCCGKTYRLNPEIGKQIAKGIEVELREEDMEEVRDGWSYGQDYDQNYGQTSSRTSTWANWKNEVKTCENCGYTTDEDFDFCPKCGKRL